MTVNWDQSYLCNSLRYVRVRFLMVTSRCDQKYLLTDQGLSKSYVSRTAFSRGQLYVYHSQAEWELTFPRDNLQMWPTCMTAKGELGYGPLCKMPFMSQCCHAPWDLRHKRDPAVTLTLCLKSSLLWHIGIETQRDPDVTLTLCTKSSLLWHIVAWTQRDPAVTLTLCIKSSLLWHTGIVTPRDPDVTLTLTLCLKSSPLWYIEIVTERHWGTMGL